MAAAQPTGDAHPPRAHSRVFLGEDPHARFDPYLRYSAVGSDSSALLPSVGTFLLRPLEAAGTPER